jgi:hypothetical protein
MPICAQLGLRIGRWHDVTVLDKLNGAMVVDIRAGLLTPTLETMRDIGFLADVAKGRAMVDAAAMTYEAFIADQANSYVMRGRVRFWMEGVAREFDRMNVIS